MAVADDVAGALGPLGWGPRVQALYASVTGEGWTPGRVVRIERAGGFVAGPDGGEALVPTAATLGAAPLGVGDWVVVADGFIQEVLPRWSTLARADLSGVGEQVLATNVDLVLVTAPADRLSPSRVERELAIGWESGARPVVVLTKADVAGPHAAEELRARLVGVDVVATSVRAGLGVEEVRAAMQPNRTAVLLGPSGAGKSTLANALLGDEVLATGSVRDEDHRGRHTTTSRHLLAVPGGGVLIDTPGLRTLGLTGDEGVEAAFPEIEVLAAGCRFRDCAHDAEPGCEVRAAVAEGMLDAARFDSYRKLVRESAAVARRTDPLLRKATLGVWKATIKSARDNDKHKPR